MKRRSPVRGLCLVFLAVAAYAAEPLPDYDVRLLSQEAEADSKAGVRKAAGIEAIRASYGESPDLRYTLTRAGAPRNLFRRGGVLEAAASTGASPAAAVRAFLIRRRALFGLGGEDLGGLTSAGVQRLSGGATIAAFEQRVGGAPVWGGGVRVALNSRGDVVQALAGDLVDPASVDPRVELTAAEAAAAALRALGVEQPESESDSQLEPLPSASERSRFRSPRAGLVDVRRVVFPLFDRSGRAAYRVFADDAREGSYELVIDAQSGATLYRASTVSHMGEARVWPKSPLEGERELRAFGAGWIDDETQATRGNNVDAFLDRDLNSSPDPGDLPDMVGGRAFSPTRSFDFAAGDLTTGEDPRDFPAAAVASVFYFINLAHDLFYNLGFDEEAGNFQNSNNGLGGEGNDAILAAVQAGSSGSFLRRPEGVAPRIRMGLRSGGTPADRTDDADFAYASQVIFHEYAHGVTSRLVGGPDNVNCLNSRVADGLAEGWSDYYGISFTDDPVMGAYDAPPRRERGIRRHSYEGYPLTHQDLGNEGFQVHRDGEIWAGALWVVRKRLGAEATDLLVTAALPLTPCNPSMPEAKDAILTADELLNGGANAAALHEVFAAHGLGYSSSGIDGFRLTQSVVFNAAFDLPPAAGENRNPIVLSAVPAPVEYRTALTYRIAAEDPDGDPLAYSLMRGPAGLAVDDEGVVSWTANEFTPQLALVEVSDGRGGRVVHGFTIPVITTLQPGASETISALPGDSGLVQIPVPSGRELLQIRLRGDEGDRLNDGDLFVIPPDAPSSVSFRAGSNETLTFPQPRAGMWRMQVAAIPRFSDIEISAHYPAIETLPLDELVEGLSGVVSSETVYRLSVPAEVESFSVVTGEGTGDVELFLAEGRVPYCQPSSAVSHPCVFDAFSVNAGTVERIDVGASEGEAAQSVPREYFLTILGFRTYADVSLAVLPNDGTARPMLSEDGVVNAANYGFYLSAGAIGTLFGADLAGADDAAASTPLPTELGGVRVRVDGVDAPLFFVSEGQINFQIPYEAEQTVFPSITVSRDGRLGPYSELFLFGNAVEIFVGAAADGSPLPIVVHASDGRLVTADNPAQPGEALIAFATGLRDVANRPASGEPAPSGPLSTAEIDVEAEVGGREAEVLFAGLTPGLVGLAQFNLVVPEASPAGPAELTIAAGFYVSDPVEIMIGGAPSE